ncbi:MAG: hypothetical protein D6759_18485, partial [Chloroflexi bacterium]
MNEKRMNVWLILGALLIVAAVALVACGGQATPAPTTPPKAKPVSPTQPPPPKATEAPTMSFAQYLDQAMDAAKAGDAEKAKEMLNGALQAAENDADKALVNELLDDVEKGNLDEVAED